MALGINTNVASLNAQRNLSASHASVGKALQRLSSGVRVNSAADDAAGLAISERFTTQIRGLNQAIRNANDGISMLQTSDGALSKVNDNLQRIRDTRPASHGDHVVVLDDGTQLQMSRVYRERLDGSPQ